MSLLKAGREGGRKQVVISHPAGRSPPHPHGAPRQGYLLGKRGAPRSHHPKTIPIPSPIPLSGGPSSPCSEVSSLHLLRVGEKSRWLRGLGSEGGRSPQHPRRRPRGQLRKLLVGLRVHLCTGDSVVFHFTIVKLSLLGHPLHSAAPQQAPCLCLEKPQKEGLPAHRDPQTPRVPEDPARKRPFFLTGLLKSWKQKIKMTFNLTPERTTHYISFSLSLSLTHTHTHTHTHARTHVLLQTGHHPGQSLLESAFFL